MINNQTENRTRIITTLSILAAISLVLLAIPFLRFPIFPTAPFLEFDMADVPIILGALIFGPFWGLILTLVVCIFQGIVLSSNSGIWGILMHFIASGTYVVVAGAFYRRGMSKKNPLGLLIGTITAVAIMMPANIVITPIYTGAPRQVIIDMILPTLLPFNLIKFAANSIIAYILFNKLDKQIDMLIMKKNYPDEQELDLLDTNENKETIEKNNPAEYTN